MRSYFKVSSGAASWRLVLGSLLALVHAACSDSKDVEPAHAEPSGARIYATVSSTNEVLAIDDDSHKLLHSYAVGRGPAIIVATPGQKKLYTANWQDNTVSVIDVASDKVVNIQMPGRPYVIAIDGAGRFVYAGLDSNAIAIIDTETDKIERSIATGELPASLIVSPDGKTLYVAYLKILQLGAGSLEAISTETGEVIHPAIPVGRAPAWITISPDGSKVFTLNFLSDDVTVVDTESFRVVATVSTGAGSQAIIGNVTPDSTRLYVTNHGTSELAAIDIASAKLVQPTIKLDGRPVGVNFSPDGKRVYTTDFGAQSASEPLMIGYLLTGTFSATGPGQVRVFDVASGQPVGETITVGPGPTSLVVSSKPD